MTSHKEPATHQAHSHMWIVGALGIAAGLALMIYVPTLKAVSQGILLFAAFHIAGGVVLLASIYVSGGDRIAKRLAALAGGTRAAPGEYDFGWATAWTNGPWIAALIAISTAAALEVAAPALWPLSLALALLAACFFAGFRFVRASARYDHALLPMVDLLTREDDLVLDAGCGAGRTTIAMGRAFKKARIVSLDRFDSDYIEGGGRALLEQNLRLAGLTDRVRIERGDLTSLPFAPESFDSAVSTHAIDHLGQATEQGLREILRILKPGGRFLLVVWVPGWMMFAVANVMSFFLSPKRDWRRMAKSAGFDIADEGMFNGVWFLLLSKPAAGALKAKP